MQDNGTSRESIFSVIDGDCSLIGLCKTYLFLVLHVLL